MKKTLLYILLLCTTNVFAGITTYTFTDKQWASKQGTIACDGKNDGWISDKDGTEYSSLYQIGVKVTAKGTGAGATSVQSFTNVRRLTINYATTRLQARAVFAFKSAKIAPSTRYSHSLIPTTET